MDQQPEPGQAAPVDHHPHYPALVGFLSDPSAEQWSARISGWNPDNPNICDWAGISCEVFPDRGYPQVVGINIPCTAGPGQLHSTIPTELGTIDTLRELMAYDCDLVGTMPTELAGLPRLKKLLLGYNTLTGTIPQHFVSNDLTGIWLEHNELRGQIPSIFGSKDEEGHRRSSSLLTLSLTSNHLSGSLPDDLSELESLEMMELSHNEMSGKVPPWLKDLNFVALTHNQFSGSVPMGVCDVVGHNLDHYVLEGNPSLKGCDNGIAPFILGALVLAFLLARLTLFIKHRCRCKCTLPRWECSCPKLTMPTCPNMPEMPKMPTMAWPRIPCPRIYLPSLPLFSRNKAKVLDDSMSDFRMTTEWGAARRRWWQTKPADNSNLKSAEIRKKIKYGESARPEMSRRNSWAALADRVESRAKNSKAGIGGGGGEEEVWFVPIPEKFDEQSAVIVDGAEEIMDISIPKGYEGNATDGEKRSSNTKRKKKKKKKKSPTT